MTEEVKNAYEDDEVFVVLPQIYGITGKLSYKLPDNFEKTQKGEYSSKCVKSLTREEVKTIKKAEIT